ncbi:MAG: DUF5671 domain-containing protein, partial [Anaerolineae bacterium]
MSNVRRAYVYLACIASAEAVAWAIISLLRNLLAPGQYTSLENTALQIAVIIVGLPIFLVHWLWAQRLARRQPEERGAILRRLYLYVAMASFLGPILANTFDLLDGLLGWAFGQALESYRYSALSWGGVFAHHLAAIIVLTLLWHYHWRVLRQDSQTIPDTDGRATVRRLYIYGFGAAGLTMTVLAVTNLSLWLMLQFGAASVISRPSAVIAELARLL